ncbi:hypothetical protein K0M31_003134 [Melipona bicolor]|uniref:Uncharacterized protein n=1 Tax=Melipona bicolor TaxID=60889 RepID=A0AA40G146_9HYME|nr:hypothetical protein K0M31_003134 [Melipona bicolor]
MQPRCNIGIINNVTLKTEKKIVKRGVNIAQVDVNLLMEIKISSSVMSGGSPRLWKQYSGPEGRDSKNKAYVEPGAETSLPTIYSKVIETIVDLIRADCRVNTDPAQTDPGEGFAFLPYSWAFNSRERGRGSGWAEDEVWVAGPE